MFQGKSRIGFGSSFEPPKIIDPDRYVDFFGYSDEASQKNSLINDMLDEIERKFYHPSMIDIMQIMIHSDDCSVCKKSLPTWDKITSALEKRFGSKYHHMTLEIRESMTVDGIELNGGSLYKAFNAKGVPFFLQNFSSTTLRKGRSRSSPGYQISKSEWFKVAEGFLQPFEFLASSFSIENKFVSSKIGNDDPFSSPF